MLMIKRGIKVYLRDSKPRVEVSVIKRLIGNLYEVELPNKNRCKVWKHELDIEVNHEKN